MKKATRLVIIVLLICTSLSGFSQKYKSPDDTVKLNTEYLKLSNAIAELTADLIVAQNKLPNYQSKANDAGSDAYKAATSSSDQASKATDGSVKDARKAKKKAKKAYNEAKDARSADNNLEDQQDKIKKLSSQLDKKKERMGKLDEMRAAINAKLLLN